MCVFMSLSEFIVYNWYSNSHPYMQSNAILSCLYVFFLVILCTGSAIKHCKLYKIDCRIFFGFVFYIFERQLFVCFQNPLKTNTKQRNPMLRQLRNKNKILFLKKSHKIQENILNVKRIQRWGKQMSVTFWFPSISHRTLFYFYFSFRFVCYLQWKANINLVRTIL